MEGIAVDLALERRDTLLFMKWKKVKVYSHIPLDGVLQTYCAYF